MQNDTPIQSLETKGVAYIHYPKKLREAVEEAVEAWKIFCSSPEETKLQFPYQSSMGMGVGYELKQTPGATLDLKEDFHVTIAGRDWIEETAQSLHNDAVLAFSDKTQKMISLMEPLVVRFAQQIETEFAVPDFAKDIQEAKNTWFVRFLHYFGERKPGDEIATPHADKSGFTLHLYESDPGLQYLDFKKEWRDMPVSLDETAIIPGMRLQYRSRNRLKATYHRVIATEKTAKEGRFSAVCFIHPNHTPQYDKQRGGRLQEFKPGFNYDMSFEEFAKLFKD